MGVLGIIGPSVGDDHFGRFEPKRQHLWAVDFLPAQQGTRIAEILDDDVRKSLRTAIRTFAAPQVGFEALEVIHGNEKYGIVGRANWRDNAISATFYDVIPNKFGNAGDDNSTFISPATIWYEIASLQQNPLTARGAYSTDYKMNVILSIYGPDEVEIERFLFHGAFIENLALGELSYDGTEPREVSVDLRYDMWYRISTTETTIPSEFVGIEFDKQG